MAHAAAFLGLASCLPWQAAATRASGGGPAGALAGSGFDAAVEVLAVWPHDDGAFTQGLVWSDDVVYESTGRYGESEVRVWELATGQVLRRHALEERFFGEGLARVADRVIQLTWREGVALVYDAATLEPLGAFQYEGEGWGLCFDGRELVMSDGSAVLAFRYPTDFSVTRTVAVTFAGKPLLGLNDLACADGRVFANIFDHDVIVRIDPGTGEVDARIDASGLRRLLPPETRQHAGALNGIAYRKDAGTFLVTGKLWPNVFEVKFVE